MADAGGAVEAAAVIRVLDPNGNVVAEYPGITLEMSAEIGGYEEGADDGGDRPNAGQ